MNKQNKNILTTITTLPGYSEIQFWTDGSVTYKDNNGYIPITEPKAIISIVNKLRDVPTKLLSIDDLRHYVEERPNDVLLQTLYAQMQPEESIDKINGAHLLKSLTDIEREE